jgi:uncharacterized protein (DUF58 family)
MIPDFAKPFTYQINWRSRSYHSGGHRGTLAGVGMEFLGNVPLVDFPDARRIDISQTIRDPAEQVHVRIFNQNNAMPIYAVCDLSASMCFSGRRRKMALAAEISASIALSAQQAGDTFAFFGFDRIVREDWQVISSYRMQDAYDMISRLVSYQSEAVGSEGLLDVYSYLGQARGLVFLISDFHMPLELLENCLNTLSNHHVVPVVLWDAEEYRALPKFGFSTIIDPETGEHRTLLFRAALIKKFEQAFRERKEALDALFLKYEMPPYFVEDGFDAQAISAYFYQFSAL